MSDTAKIVCALILVVLVIILCSTTLTTNTEVPQNDLKNEVEKVNLLDDSTNENQYNNNFNESKNESKNEIKNTNMKNVIENDIILDTMVTSNTQNNVYESQTDAGTTDKKQQAINLVKEKWGEDETVTFRCDNISNEEYIVAVVSKQTASVQNYFRVNLEKQTVTVDY